MKAFRSTALGLFALCAAAWMAQGAEVRAVPVTGLNLNLSLSHDGRPRSYDVLVPSNYDGSVPVPLVVDIHGFGGVRAIQRLGSGFDRLSEEEGFIVVWPQGLFTNSDIDTNSGGPSWNAGDWCCGEAAMQDVDDVGFIRALVTTLLGEINIDRRRIYVTGFSNGGALTHRLACEAADLFAAAASFAFSSSLVVPCIPSRPIPVLMVHSRIDEIVPYAGGHVVFGNPALPIVPSAAEGFEAWRGRNECASSVADVTENPGITSECELYTSCANGAQVGLCSVDATLANAGHSPYSQRLADGFDSEERAWEFLSGSELPRCSSRPIDGCRTSEKSLLLLKQQGGAKDKLIWKWIKGEATKQQEFGDPLRGTEDAICVYGGVERDLLATIRVPSTPSLWSGIGTKGYKFKDSLAAADGLQIVLLKGSTVDNAKILAKGKGVNLPDPVLPLELPVTLQLVNTTTEVCWESMFDEADVLKNEQGAFKAKH